jgi:hypothetical protein
MRKIAEQNSKSYHCKTTDKLKIIDEKTGLPGLFYLQNEAPEPDELNPLFHHINLFVVIKSTALFE